MTVSDATTSSLNELKSLVSTTLEHAGVLARIRAQLRHHVFLAVNDQPVKANQSKPNTKALASQLTGDDRLLLDLINDFLTIDYEYSSLTFRAECGLSQNDVLNRDQLADKCGLRSAEINQSKSLLLTLIQRGLQSYQSGDKPLVNQSIASSDSRSQSVSNSTRQSASNSVSNSAHHSKQPSIDASSRDEFDVEAQSEPQSPVQTRQPNQPINQSINDTMQQTKTAFTESTPAFKSTLSSLPPFNALKPAINNHVWDRSEDVSSDESDSEPTNQSTNQFNNRSNPQSNEQSKQTSDEEVEEEPEIEVDVDEEFYESSPISHSPVHQSINQFNSSFATTQPSAAISAIQSKSSTQTLLSNNQSINPSSSLSSLSSLPSMNSSSLGKTSLLGNMPSLGVKPISQSSGFGRPKFDDLDSESDNDQTNDHNDDDQPDDVNDSNPADESDIDSDEEKLREIDRNIAALEAKQREQSSKYLSSTSSRDSLQSLNADLSKTAPMTAAPINSFNSTSAFGSTLAAGAFKGTKSPVADDYADEFGDDQGEVEIEEAIEEDIEEEVEIEISGDEEF